MSKGVGRGGARASHRMKNDGWIAGHATSPEARRRYEQEQLIVWAMEAIARAMKAAGMTKADLARKLGTSRAHITQVLGGSRNATLRTLADLAWACGSRVTVSVEPLRECRPMASTVPLTDAAAATASVPDRPALAASKRSGAGRRGAQSAASPAARTHHGALE